MRLTATSQSIAVTFRFRQQSDLFGMPPRASNLRVPFALGHLDFESRVREFGLRLHDGAVILTPGQGEFGVTVAFRDLDLQPGIGHRRLHFGLCFRLIQGTKFVDVIEVRRAPDNHAAVPAWSFDGRYRENRPKAAGPVFV